jgi:hypothetical protein
MKVDQLADRYGVTATDDDARRLAQAVKMIFEKVEAEFSAHAGYVAAHAMNTAIDKHLLQSESLLGQARFASILIDTMPTTWSPMLKASFVYVLAPRLKEVLRG